MREYAMSEQEAYLKKLQAQLDAYKAEIGQLKAKAEQAAAEAQLEYYKRIEDLRGKQETVRAQLEILKQGKKEAWDSLKQDAGHAWSNVKSTFKKTKQAFKDGLEEKQKEKR